jgi:hypothetical protein
LNHHNDGRKKMQTQSPLLWQREAQGFSLATAINLNEEWTLAEIRTLETLKAGNMPIKDIAKQLGRSYYSVSNKLTTSGLTTPRNTPPAPKAQVCGVCFVTPSSSGVCYC